MIVHEYRPRILAIQEPHRVKSIDMDRTLCGDYQWVNKTNQNIYHSVAIGIRRNIPYTEITLDTDLPIIAVRITVPFPVTIVCGHLLNGTIHNLEEKLDKLFTNLCSPTIAFFDVNGHHVKWGSSKCNTGGITVLNATERVGLTVLNSGQTTRTSGKSIVYYGRLKKIHGEAITIQLSYNTTSLPQKQQNAHGGCIIELTGLSFRTKLAFPD